MHYRTEIDVKQRRVTHRTTIKGEALGAPREWVERRLTEA
jgi:hypothetical protein